VTPIQRPAPRPLPQIFAVPIVLGVVSTIGLVAALIGDDIWDAIGWIGLGIPLAVTVWCVRPK